ncbi:hypothetical protein HDA40_000528 [Hamadaea flava]|uniref:Uncharacterized protein n=1 Tax=Hamadaea flava TaxID=1742688 RepID=A0ABV8M0S2_9ACTN|nr:hypothetical protein [Hamadaea flava]MCP2322021.1 hypothetical protein [Hamadaea flava]
MSFGTYARKVADPSLPFGRRLTALGSCVQLYRPIGFHATFSYLRRVAGPIRRDEAALLHALDVLSRSRTLWLADVEAYAARRRLAKRAGYRSTRPGDPNPSWPDRWYGDVRGGALAVIGRWRKRAACQTDEHGRQVLTVAKAFVAADGHLDPVQVAALREL